MYTCVCIYIYIYIYNMVTEDNLKVSEHFGSSFLKNTLFFLDIY